MLVFVACRFEAEEEKWLGLEWHKPEDETTPCWSSRDRKTHTLSYVIWIRIAFAIPRWIVNAAEQDKSKAPVFVSRSLCCLKLEVYSHRMATTAKLRHEFDKRFDINFLATEALKNNERLWSQVGGPNPDDLFEPSYSDLADARRAAQKLQSMLDKGGKERDQVAQHAEEIISAVQQIKPLHWEAIYQERFSITPITAWDAIVRNVEGLIGRRDRETERRRKRLAEPQQEGDDAEDEPALPQEDQDRFGLDFGRFKNLLGQKPYGWSRAIRAASEVCLDEMRTLFEMHYENAHVDLHRHCSRAPSRKSEYKIKAGVVKDYQRKLSVRLALPRSVKAIFQNMEHEKDWKKLEEFRLALQDICQGKTEVNIANQEETRALVEAIRTAPRNRHGIEVGDGFKKIPAGCFVEITNAWKGRHTDPGVAASMFERSGAEKVTVLMRPRYSSKRPCMLDPFAKTLFGEATARQLAAKSHLDADELFDKMALVLYDQLFLELSDAWTRMGKANLESTDTNDLARYFLLGMNIGQKPIFENLCSNCGCFLFGGLGDNDGLSNKRAGVPRDKDGKVHVNDDGTYNVGAQPPFLLRWSPSFFAKEVPAAFEYDAAENRLRLKAGVEPPWLRQFGKGGATDPDASWLYCSTCVDQHKKNGFHIPYRDKASQQWCKRVQKPDVAMTQDGAQSSQAQPSTLPQPEEEPLLDGEQPDEIVDGAFVQEDEEEAGEEERDIAFDPLVARPTFEEYRVKWKAAYEQHSREVSGEFSRENLVPKPVPALFQDCPWVPFNELKSNEAMSRLAAARPTADGIKSKLYFATSIVTNSHISHQLPAHSARHT